jgi:hypothetical protein
MEGQFHEMPLSYEDCRQTLERTCNFLNIPQIDFFKILMVIKVIFFIYLQLTS